MKPNSMVTLLNPKMCMNCPFNNGPSIVQKEFASFTGLIEVKIPVTCTRKDCDNWVWNSQEPIKVK